jgi:hypothetical protein
VKQQHTSTATSILTTKSTYRSLTAQRLSERTVPINNGLQLVSVVFTYGILFIFTLSWLSFFKVKERLSITGVVMLQDFTVFPYQFDSTIVPYSPITSFPNPMGCYSPELINTTSVFKVGFSFLIPLTYLCVSQTSLNGGIPKTIVYIPTNPCL